ncbi:hypothetical protein CIL05_07005 [Virgibacillus profundi]|uniref:Uncharacterized protein n=1 Tax=Virgibacillus profundi TaxID=2024555 RepID=A0A2A2IFR2_9BACI|nr:hypothetical protein [Virgibacillus profundi]PAV30208.1 hypothetical protein CIL05_07005 [Virgibacillus profundi]PXY54380.1 hypothetical protein CIT14_07090 [Virgibacillus profundi]
MNKFTVTNEFINQMIEIANNQGIDYNMFEGSLTDNFIFYDTERIKITEVGQSKYLIIKENFVNTWTSELELIATNEISTVEKYEEIFI